MVGRPTAGLMVLPAAPPHSAGMSTHWTIYVAGACSIGLAIAIIVMVWLK